MRVRLMTERFFSGKPVSVELCTPAPYIAEVHEQAESDQCHAALGEHEELEVERMDNGIAVQMPALKPWGMLVVRV